MFKKIISYLAWPVVCGLLLALLYLQQPLRLLPDNNKNVPYSYASAVNKALPSVVNIYTRTRVKQRASLFNDPIFNYFFQPRQQRFQSSLGSGVIINKEGYLLTNHHVVNGADQIVVLLHDGRESLASVIGSDSEIDLAVLKVDLPNLSPISLGDISSSQVGDVVLAIGNPYGIGQTVTQGIISASSRDGLRLSSNYIQTDAAINPGNSGGALIDAKGNLLGINTTILNKTGSSIGISFAIPVDTAIKVLEDIIHYGKVIRGTLGIVPSIVPERATRKLGLEKGVGILITAIYRNGPAHKAGLMPGDIILQLNGDIVKGNEAGMDKIAKSVPGKKISLTLLRNNQKITLDVIPDIRVN